MKSLDPFCPRSFQLSRMILGRSPTLIVMAFHMSTPSPFGARPPGLGECNHVRFVCLMQVRYAPSGYTSTIYIILNHIMMYLLYIQIMMMNDLTNYIWFLLFHSIKIYLYLLRVVFFIVTSWIHCRPQKKKRPRLWLTKFLCLAVGTASIPFQYIVLWALQKAKGAGKSSQKKPEHRLEEFTRNALTADWIPQDF